MSATVLVVDDEPKLRHLVRDYLERDGYVVLEAGTGQRALELARAARPALVVLDLGLPDLPGEDVAWLLRHDSAVAVIVLTARPTRPLVWQACGQVPTTMSPSRSAPANSSPASMPSCDARVGSRPPAAPSAAEVCA